MSRRISASSSKKKDLLQRITSLQDLPVRPSPASHLNQSILSMPVCPTSVCRVFFDARRMERYECCQELQQIRMQARTNIVGQGGSGAERLRLHCFRKVEPNIPGQLHGFLPRL